MKRIAIFVYGVAAYLIFLATLLYAVGFVGNLWLPKTIDSGPTGGLATALVVNLVLLGLFAVPHSVMARPAFKTWWCRWVPVAAERSTYVLVSSLLLALLFWQWRPLPGVVWEVGAPAGQMALWALFWAGWACVVASTFMIDHFDLFGLRQVTLHLRGREYAPIGFKTPFLYRYMRHPIMTGFLLAFWATPRMSVGHLLFALATTGYVLIGVLLEERDLLRYYGERYADYRRRVGMLLPLPRRRKA